MTSAYGQHMMPFLRDEVNGKAVDVENDLIQFHYNFTPRVAWVPERVWVDNPDNDGNGTTATANVLDWIGDDFTQRREAVLLDDYIHCGYENNAFDDHHIYTIGTGLKIIPIDNNFVGEVNYDWGNAWNRIVGPGRPTNSSSTATIGSSAPKCRKAPATRKRSITTSRSCNCARRTAASSAPGS